MKSFSKFSLIFLTISLVVSSPFARAREVFLITFSDNNSEDIVELAQNHLKERYKIPKRLIHLRRESSPCLANENALAHLCLDKDDKLKIVKANFKYIKKSFSIFSNEVEK